MITKTLLLGAMLGLAAPVLANSHAEKKAAAGTTATTSHDGMAMDHSKMDTSKMSKKDKAAHDKMMRDAMKKQAAADKMATPK